MSAPTDKQTAFLKKMGRDIPKTGKEAYDLISSLCGNKKGLPPNGESQGTSSSMKEEVNSFKEACDTIAKYAETCKQLGYPIEYWNLSTVWNTAMMRK